MAENDRARLPRPHDPQAAHRPAPQQGHRDLPLQEEQDHALQGPGPARGSEDGGGEGRQGEAKVQTKNVILATGSRPRSLPGITPDGKTIVTSDEILRAQGDSPEPGRHRGRRGGHRVRVDLRPLRDDRHRHRDAAARPAPRGRGDLGGSGQAAGQADGDLHGGAHGGRAQDRDRGRGRLQERHGGGEHGDRGDAPDRGGPGPGDRRPGPREHQGAARQGLHPRERRRWPRTSPASTRSATS